VSQSSTVIRRDFFKELDLFCEVRNLIPTPFNVTGRMGNLKKVSTGTGQLLFALYVKVKTENPPFWGINVNQLNSLTSRSGHNWFLVLLLGGGPFYIIPAQEVNRTVDSLPFQGDKGEFKLHARDVEPFDRFYDYKSLLARLPWP